MPTTHSIWERRPSWSDPRLAVLALLLTYLLLGITVLGFNRSPAQIGLVIGTACLLDMGFHWLFCQRRLLFPLSAAITGCSLSILTNFAHGLWLPLVPVFLAIASKYLITVHGRHVFNPALFGITTSLLISRGMISASPAYQWGGSAAMVMFIVTAAVLLFALRIRRTALILSFLGLYTLQLLLRAYLTQYMVPPETLLLGALTSPAFYLFTFFMITDPATAPRTVKGQVGMAVSIVLIDLYLHKVESLSTFFYAGFAYFSARYLWLRVRAWQSPSDLSPSRPLAAPWLRWSFVSILVTSGIWLYQQGAIAQSPITPTFQFTKLDTARSGISTHSSDILERVDPRLQPVGKWLLSVGDAVAVADADGDGWQDIFLTYPLKAAGDRAALYRNLGDFQFERVPLPALNEMVAHPDTEGLPSGALWFDDDNDGDPDLLINVGYGKTRLLQNLWMETGQLTFKDVSPERGFDDYTISLTANALDVDRDGQLEVMVGNAMNPWFPDYDSPVPVNIFHLPDAEYEGDRRMFNIMHRSWHDADNGGTNLFYWNRGGTFEQQDAESMGLAGHRWTLDIGTGDLDEDGWTDLYLANDFGPDQLYLNRGGKTFAAVRGSLVGSVGHDAYKGMNASVGDVDNDGHLDVYVSNVHEPLQAEGSLLWMNQGTVNKAGAAGFEDEAMERNALNESRFGWGGAMGDLDRDGRLDILQANGMIDNRYDDHHTITENPRRPGKVTTPHRFKHDATDPGCPDYWYWNSQIALTPPDVHGYADRWADLRGRCIFPYEANRVYLNRGDRFLDVASQVGWTELGNSRGIALADLDNDGDLDALVTHQFDPVSIYRNDAIPNADGDTTDWIGLQLQGNGKQCNRDAVGTRAVLSTPNGQQVREVQESNGFSAQGDRRLLFGLGSLGASRILSEGDDTPELDAPELHIHWCGASTPQVLRLSPNRYHTIVQLPSL
ncbi:MAG: FG-GAP-like repeat-containing protein [Elainellaceae cyanobacterium]